MDKRDMIIKEHLPMIKGVTRAYADPYTDRWDVLCGAAMEGAADALSTFDKSKGDIKQHLRRGCRNYILMQLRKMQRWDKEVPMSVVQDKYNTRSRGVGGGDDEDLSDVTFTTSVSANTQGLGNAPMWIESMLNPEEQYIREEELSIAREKVHKLQSGFNERELYVLWNHIIGEEPISLREIAKQFKVDKSSIHRDVKRIRNQLKIEDN